MGTKATQAPIAMSHHLGVLGVTQRLLHFLQEPKTGAIATLVRALGWWFDRFWLYTWQYQVQSHLPFTSRFSLPLILHQFYQLSNSHGFAKWSTL
jgi:hypothetical protein